MKSFVRNALNQLSERLADVSLDFIRCYTVFLKYKLHLKCMLRVKSNTGLFENHAPCVQ